ncbi:hypothetical protein J6590_016799 [Homalodisca vitripennis]|nr:hypothetical protein J6590_016799 [Homalodisca vitripennis]
MWQDIISASVRLRRRGSWSVGRRQQAAAVFTYGTNLSLPETTYLPSRLTWRISIGPLPALPRCVAGAQKCEQCGQVIGNVIRGKVSRRFSGRIAMKRAKPASGMSEHIKKLPVTHKAEIYLPRCKRVVFVSGELIVVNLTICEKSLLQ